MKLLIVNFWDPENTRYFGKYADAIDTLFSSLESVELFSNTISKDAEDPIKEKVDGLKKAVEHATKNNFVRLLILGEGNVLTKDMFQIMSSVDSEVVLTKSESFACCLIRVRIVEMYPIPYLGEFSAPDKMWLKCLKQNNVKISVINDIKPVYLDEL